MASLMKECGARIEVETGVASFSCLEEWHAEQDWTFSIGLWSYGVWANE